MVINSTKEEDDNVVGFNVMLTTIDNPFNPFTQYESWYSFDSSKNYNTRNYLARIVKSSDELSEVDQASALEKGIDEIVKLNILGIYLKVTPDSFKDRSKSFNIDSLGL